VGFGGGGILHPNSVEWTHLFPWFGTLTSAGAVGVITNIKQNVVLIIVFSPEGGGGSSTQAWMPTYVSILRIPQMI
jgi:Zn-dependent protease